jgi:hypothetical protein
VRRRTAAFAAALCALAAPIALAAQMQRPSEIKPGKPGPDPLAAKVPFGPGERLDYQVKLGKLNAGEGSLAVEGVDTVRGRPTYHLTMNIKGSTLFGALKVTDAYQSWLDTRDLVSLHFVSDKHEVRYKSFKEFAIYPSEKRWQQLDENHADSMSTDQPLDEIAFMYWLRTIPLEVGQTYTYDRYFQRKSNPVVIKVVRRESREVPAGTFDCIVVQPVITNAGGLFGKGGNAELYFTDDTDRRLVYMRSELPVVGSITLHLKAVRSGGHGPAA